MMKRGAPFLTKHPNAWSHFQVYYMHLFTSDMDFTENYMFAAAIPKLGC